MNERRHRVLLSHLTMAAMLGAPPIGFGVPCQPEDRRRSLLVAAPEQRRKLRPLAERKERRRKRKQRSGR